jgi:hypothetical protein
MILEISSKTVSRCIRSEAFSLVHITRNIFSFTPRFIAAGLPSSNSNPASPPSPDIPSSLSRSSSSSSAIVFFLMGSFLSEAAFLLESTSEVCKWCQRNGRVLAWQGRTLLSRAAACVDFAAVGTSRKVLRFKLHVVVGTNRQAWRRILIDAIGD